MELRQIKYFMTVAEELHFGRAAARLKITQPPLSQQILQLETEMGVKLFKRTKRHVELTNAGKVFWKEIRDILPKLEQAKALARKAEEGMTGQLIVGFVGSATFATLPIIVRSFRERYPDVDLILHEMPTPRLIEALQNDEIDIGFVRPAVDNSSIAMLSIHHETSIAVVPKIHSLAQQTSVSMRDLQQEQFILVEREIWPSWYDDILSKCSQAGFSPVIRQSVKEIQTAVGLVASGLGISIVPKSTSQFHLSEVSYVDIEPESPHIELSLAWRASDQSILVKHFLHTATQLIK